MPRFVILLHQLPPGAPRAGTHWDFMLECDGALRTWALDAEPTVGATIDALELADHRLDYLRYEGPVSGNRGTVSRWDEGSYQFVEQTKNWLSLQLHGRRLNGHVELKRAPFDHSGSPQRWTFSLATEA